MISGIINEAMQTQCRKCSEKQKELLNVLSDWFTKNKPEEWEALVKKTIENVQNKNA